MSGFSASREGLWNHAQKVSTIYFEKGTWQEIDLTEAEKIDYTAKMLTADPKTKVILTGHASAEGTADSNRTLSINRAMKVKTLLAAKGVDPKMITANGL
ncbi:MAG: OmpA family protein, partial [Terrimicrobiaceae bacterium]